VVVPSTKEQIVRVAERLFGERGVDGVSLRQIGAAAGNGNNSVVQYHFGSKDQLIRAIFADRMPSLHQRRKLLIAEHRPRDVRSWVECYVRPIFEQAEQEGSHYLTFVAMLSRHGRRDVFERQPDEYQESLRSFRTELGALLRHIPEPLRTHRITQVMAFAVHAGAGREHALTNGEPVLPFAVHMNDLLDGLVGFLEAPVSRTALAALDGTRSGRVSWPLHL
jgi:AcrR family transcriptional regulator